MKKLSCKVKRLQEQKNNANQYYDLCEEIEAVFKLDLKNLTPEQQIRVNKLRDKLREEEATIVEEETYRL